LIQYFDALKKIADGQASKVFFPVELSNFASALGLIGENLKGKE